MHVFVTGATGFVGSAVVRHLLVAGHSVTGLTRSDRSATALAAAGAAVQRGELADTALLADAADAADAVMHLGYIHDFSRMDVAAQTDIAAIGALGEALVGSDRPLLVTSGLAMLTPGRDATELDASSHAAGNGRASELAAAPFAERGVRIGMVRLPPSVHGRGDHGFVPTLIDIARQKGVSAYVDNGENLWSAVHVEDAAQLYVKALESLGPNLTCFHAAEDGGIAFRDIASAIGQGLGVPTQSIPQEAASEHFGWMGLFAGLGMSASSARTREKLDWHPTGPSLLEDLATGDYFDPARRGIS
jgi:nucleoside-diphosphate-sugar epimerase